MNLEEIKKIIATSTEKLNLLDFQIFKTENKVFLNYIDSTKEILVKVENIYQFKSLNIIDLISTKFPEYFITAEKIMFRNDDMFVYYNIQNVEFLNFGSEAFMNITPSDAFVIFRDYLKILMKLLLLKEDFSKFDSKLFFYEKNRSTGKLSIKYLYHGKNLLDINNYIISYLNLFLLICLLPI
jgi:hypothetical protein